MGPFYIQPGTPVYFEIITFDSALRRQDGTGRLTLHGFVQSDDGTYASVVVPSMNGKTFHATHSAFTYDTTPEAVTFASVPVPTISFDDFISQGRCSP